MTDQIRDLMRDERPRERMLLRGAENLSETELVALLLGSGRRGKNAIQLARELLGEGMLSLSHRDPSHLAQIPGVGVAKATRVVAAFEIARRALTGRPEDPPVFDPAVFCPPLLNAFARKRQEQLFVVILDSRGRIIKQQLMFIGTIDNVLVSTKEIVRFSLIEYACGVVLYHNHPSGDPVPSNEDSEFTKSVKHGLKLCDIRLIDHLIIGAHGWYSMAQRGDF